MRSLMNASRALLASVLSWIANDWLARSPDVCCNSALDSGTSKPQARANELVRSPYKLPHLWLALGVSPLQVLDVVASLSRSNARGALDCKSSQGLSGQVVRTATHCDAPRPASAALMKIGGTSSPGGCRAFRFGWFTGCASTAAPLSDRYPTFARPRQPASRRVWYDSAQPAPSVGALAPVEMCVPRERAVGRR